MLINHIAGVKSEVFLQPHPTFALIITSNNIRNLAIRLQLHVGDVLAVRFSVEFGLTSAAAGELTKALFMSHQVLKT